MSIGGIRRQSALTHFFRLAMGTIAASNDVAEAFGLKRYAEVALCKNISSSKYSKNKLELPSTSNARPSGNVLSEASEQEQSRRTDCIDLNSFCSLSSDS